MTDDGAPPPADVAALMFEDAQRAIARQAVRLAELHTRAIAIAGLAVAAAGFLAPAAFEKHPATGVVGAMAMAVAVVLAVAVHIPGRWKFTRDAAALLMFSKSDGISDAPSYQWLSCWDLADDFEHNNRGLRRRARWLLVTVAATGLEVCLFVAARV